MDKPPVLPTSSGVYLMKDEAGTVLYIGKAKNLKKRVQSYFVKDDHFPKIRIMMSKLRSIDYVVTGNESEALILENRFIKEYQPRYNTRLLDSKTYPYLRIDLQEPYPTIHKTRIRKDDGAAYFGPYVSGKHFNWLQNLIKETFGLRRCRTMSKRGPCLYYHLHSCLGPCAGNVDPVDYRERVNQVIWLLEGKYTTLAKDLRMRMQASSEAMNFEQASIYRDQMEALSELIVDQRVEALDSRKQIDFFVITSYLNQYLLQVFRVREGCLIEQLVFEVEKSEFDSRDQLIQQGILQFYNEDRETPDEIVTEKIDYDDDFLFFLKQSHISMRKRLKTFEKELFELLKQNSFYAMRRHVVKSKAVPYQEIALELQKELGLKRLPITISGVDISHFSGTNIVASQVVFTEGIPRKDKYRKYNIKTVSDNDDYASIFEVVSRMFKQLKKIDRPDLVLIDGGKGQLQAAMKALVECGVEGQDIASLAKREEVLYLPTMKNGVKLNRDNDALKLLQRVRDESHRFAINFQRSKRVKDFK